MKQHMTYISKIILISLIVFVFIPTGAFAESDTIEQTDTANDLQQQQDIGSDRTSEMSTNDDAVVTDDVYSDATKQNDIQKGVSENVPQDMMALITEKGKSVVGEDVGRRTRNSKYFLMNDGSYKQVISLTPKHYEDENGNWQDINTNLIDEADINPADMKLSKQFQLASTSDGEMRLGKDRQLTSYRVVHAPYDAVIPKDYKRGYSIGKGTDRIGFTPIGANSSIGSISGKFIKFSGVWTDTDVELEAIEDGMKETLFLNSARAPHTFSFEVKGQLSSDLKSDSFIVRPAWIQDSAGKIINASQTLRADGSKTIMDLSYDDTGLVYPLKLDPTVTIQPDSTSGQDAWLPSSDPVSNHGSQEFMSFGINAYLDSGSLIRFPLDVVKGQIINSAQLKMAVYSSYQAINTNNIVAYNVTSPWNEDTVTYNNAISTVDYSHTVASTPSSDAFVNGFNPYWVTLDLTALTRSWVDGSIANNGVYVSTSFFYNGSGRWDAWTSEATGQGEGYHPQLIIDYSSGAPTTPTITNPITNQMVDANTVITWNASVDPQTPQSGLKYQIQLSTNGGTSWTDLTTTGNGVVSYTYNFSSTPATSNASLRIRAFDGTLYSDWAVTNFSITHNQIPNAPTSLNPGSTSSSSPAIVIGTPVLNWTFSDPDTGDTQSAYQVQIYNGTTLVKDTNWVTSTLTSYTVPTSTLTRNTTYNWKIRTKDNAGAISNYSSVYYIKPNALPTVTITSYTDGQQLADNILTFTWTYADANSQSQTNYQILGSQDNWATTVYNSGVLNGTATSFTTPALANGTWSFKILVKDGIEWSNAALRSNLVLPNAFEPNDTNTQAFQINYNQSYNSLINSSTDLDFYKFTATSNEIDRFVLNVPTGLNYDVYFYDSAMKLITLSMQAAGTSENALFEVKIGSTYYIKVVGVGGNYSASSAYNFILSPATQQFQTTYTYDSNGNILTKTTTSS